MSGPEPIFYRVVSSQVTALAAARDGTMASISPVARPPGYTPLLAFRPHPSARLWFLMAPRLDAGARLFAAPYRSTGAIMPVITNDKATTLRPPTGTDVLTVLPLDTRTRTGRIAFSAPIAGADEQLSFKTLSNPEIPAHCLAWARLLARLCTPDVSARRLADLFINEAPTPDLAPAIDAVAALLSRDDLANVARALLEAGAGALANLRGTYPDDLSANHALPGMMEWLLHAQRGPRLREIGPELDRLDQEGLDGSFVSLPLACNMAWRRMAKPRKRACVVATARNEGLYLLEWVAYHKAVGFDDLFIYSNDNADGSDDLLRALAEAGEITWIDNRVGAGRRAQWKSYGHALRVMPDVIDYDWALFIDLDEFFVPNPELFPSVGAFIDAQERQEVDAIAINWMMVGSNRQVVWRDDVMWRRFPLGRNDVNAHIKTMLRPSRFMHSFPHDPASYRHEPWIYRNSAGALHVHNPAVGRPSLSLNPDFESARVVHFFYKSAAEFLWKASRNRGGRPVAKTVSLDALESGLLFDFVRAFDESGEPTRIEHWGAEVDARIAVLLSLPGVSAAAEVCKAVYARQMPEILRLAKDNALIRDLGPPGQQFLDALSRKQAPDGASLIPPSSYPDAEKE